MRSKIKNTVLLLIFISTIAYLAGCTKPAASVSSSAIVGTWISSTQREVTQVNNVTTTDTTTQIAGLDTFTFTSSGQLITNVAGAGGTYTVSGSTLTVFNSLAPLGAQSKITTLTSSALSIARTDTSSLSPLTTETNTYNYTR